MKNKLIFLVIILILIAIIFSVVDKKGIENKNFKPLEINVGDEFTYIDYKNKMYVLNYEMQDVNGDNNKEMIILIGEREKVENVKANSIDVVIYDTNDSNFYNLNLKNYDGKLPKINTKDVTGDKILDIILTANDENENISMRIVSFQNGEYKEIFKNKDNKGIVFTGNFVDGFKAYLSCDKYKKEVNVDLNDRKENYITNGFFDESGRLLKTESKISTTPFCRIEFVQLNEYYGIQTVQKIVGFNNDDLLDEITSVWKYENGKWNVKEAKGSVVGNLLY